MQYQLLGRSGMRVSELALGTMTFGEDWGWGATREESARIFERYVEAGGNFIDTANNYTNGTSEQFVGELIAADRDRFVLGTKYTLSERPDDPNHGGNHRKNLRRSVEASLRRLGTDWIDLLWLHMWDGTTPIDEVMRGLDDLVRTGKVLHVAVSDTPAWVVSAANTLADLRGWSPFVALQVPYSLARRDAERSLLPMAEALGLAFTPWGVLGGGVLTGKYADENATTRYKRDEVKPRQLEVAEAVTAVAGALGRSPAQVALSWVRQRLLGVPVIPIVGARSTAQLDDQLGCLDLELPPEALARLDEVTAIKLGFPRDFLEAEHIQTLIFGETRERLAW